MHKIHNTVARFTCAFFLICTTYAHAEKLGELKYVRNGVTIHLSFERKYTLIAINNRSRHSILITPENFKIVTKSGDLKRVCGFNEQQPMGLGLPMTPVLVAPRERKLAIVSYCSAATTSYVIPDKIKIKSIRIGKLRLYPNKATRLIGDRYENTIF